MTGIVKSVKVDKFYGFISADSRDYFFHSSSCPQTFHDLRPGMRVSFTPVETVKGFRAEDVQVQ